MKPLACEHLQTKVHSVLASCPLQQKIPCPNVAILLSQLYLNMSDEHGVFTLKARPGTRCIYLVQSEETKPEGGKHNFQCQRGWH